ncbi:MAG: PQQ-binding-like beta-propeller repeat protein [Steroidobacteraceae bacterium]
MRAPFISSSIRCLLLLAATLLSACGGGGGGGGGGGPPPASLSVQPASLTVTADAATSGSPTGQITITVHNASANGTYVGASSTNNAITGLSMTESGMQLILTVSFKDPSVIGPGTYTDTVQTAICTDANCTTLQAGSTISIPVTYTVSVSATVSLSADTMTTGAGIPVTLTWSSTHANSCIASGDWSGTLPSAGSQAVTPTTVGNHTYTIRCSDPGLPAEASVVVAAAAPAVTLTSFPATVALGKSATVRWRSQYASACTASGDWSGTLTTSGFRTFTASSTGTLNYHLECSNAAASAAADTSLTVGPAITAPAATAYRMTERHDGVLITTNGIQHPGASSPNWTVDLGAPVSYPLIANGTVFVTTANPDGSYGNRLYALDAHSGAKLWGPVSIAGVYFGSGLTYENGRVFVLMFNGVVSAFNAADGGALWNTQLSGNWYEGSPNAYGGMVFINGDGGLSALDESSGSILWTNGMGASTEFSSPAVSSEGVYTEGSSCFVSAFDPADGTRQWQSQSTCSPSFGYTPSVRDGTVFGRSGTSIDLFDAITGNYSVSLGSARAPAITATALIALNAGTLSSTRLSDRVQTWTYTGDGNLVTAPVVVNDTVFVGSSSGKVFGVDVATGVELWSGTAPLPLSIDSENGGPQPPSGPAAGEDMLIFPAGNSLVGWQLQ